MAEIFIRKYSLQIGINKQVLKQILPTQIKEYPERKLEGGGLILYKDRYKTATQNTSSGNYNDFTVVPDKSIKIEDPIQITADITENKDAEKVTKQSARIRIFNLTKELADNIEVGASIFLRAGYMQDKELPYLFIGQITALHITKEQTEWVVIIEADATEIVRGGAVLTKSYPPNSDLKSVVEDLAKNIAKSGIPTGEINTSPQALGLLKKAYPSGYNIQGGLLQALESVCDENGMRAYVTLGKLYIEPKQLSAGVLTKVVHVTEENFKGSLDRKKNKHGKAKTGDPKNHDNDLSLKLFLDGNITSNALIRLEVAGYEGDYTIKTIEHSLDYEGDSWDTIVKIAKVGSVDG